MPGERHSGALITTLLVAIPAIINGEVQSSKTPAKLREYSAKMEFYGGFALDEVTLESPQILH